MQFPSVQRRDELSKKLQFSIRDSLFHGQVLFNSGGPGIATNVGRCGIALASYLTDFTTQRGQDTHTHYSAPAGVSYKQSTSTRLSAATSQYTSLAPGPTTSTTALTLDDDRRKATTTTVDLQLEKSISEPCYCWRASCFREKVICL